MSVVMDLGWIMTFAAEAQTTPQISIDAEGGAGTPVPDISIEVDKIDEGSPTIGGCEIGDRVRPDD